MTETVNVEAFRAAALSGRWKGGAVLRMAPSKPKAATDGSRRIGFIFSDESIDLEGDKVSAKGWRLTEYLQNPIALFGHDASRPENVIGRGYNVSVKGTQLLGDIDFAGADVNPTADMVFRLYKGGFLNAVSVGFEPIDYEVAKDAGRPGGLDFNSQRLLEISCVPVPCNSNALAVARSRGIDTKALIRWAENVLDKGEPTAALRPAVEQVRRQAGAPSSHSVRAIVTTKSVPTMVKLEIEMAENKRTLENLYDVARAQNVPFEFVDRLVRNA